MVGGVTGTAPDIDGAVTDRITGLLYDYAHCIDDDRLEEWPDFFVEDCFYRIVPRENTDQGLSLPIIYFDNKNMLRDRVLVLRKALIYNIHFDRHLISNIRVVGEADGVYHVWSNFVIYQTDTEGATQLFSTGKYDDKVVFVDGEPKFQEKLVLIDTYAVPNMISTPL